MPATSKPARSAASFDWSSTALGDPAGWPGALRLCVDLLLNSPTPTLLLWGNNSVIVFNDAYAELAGPGYGRTPGGSVPPLLPPPLTAGRSGCEQAWRGEAALETGVALSFARPDGPCQRSCDLYFTPVRGDDGLVQGVLCALAPAREASAGAVQAAGPLRILVVEDNLDSQYLVCEMLKAFGHESEGVAHPDDALARLAAASYDVLFTDVSLPGMSGVDLARRAVREAPSMKVIFASGYGDALLRHLEFPYLSLQKPYELDDLQQALAGIARERPARP
jgi:CheY-like chemotaxis protein